MAKLVHVTADEDLSVMRKLFQEYVDAVNAPECFVGFEKELAGLPGDYELFLVYEKENPAGCVALRRLDAGTAEMKRLYVRPACRALGVVRQLAEAAIAAARVRGCRRIVLDTLPAMREAHALYRSLGFREIPAYLAAPTPGATCFELRF